MNRQVSSEHGKNNWVIDNSMHTVQELSFGDYRDFWGDEYCWTALLPFVWKMIDYPWIEFPQVNMEPQSDRETSFSAAIAIWSASIHLLGLGMGWSDIEKGLAEWETLDFATGYHPVLDTVKKLCGDDLASLSFHINLNRDEYFEVFSKLDEIPSKMYQDRKEKLNLDSVESNAVNRMTLSKLLLQGGYDPLHLSMHFRNSVIGHDEFSRDFKLKRLNDERYVLHLPRYSKWALQLKNCGAQTFNELNEISYGEVDVQIENLGSIGLFVGGGGGHFERRWFRNSETYKENKPGSQYESHSWGI